VPCRTARLTEIPQKRRRNFTTSRGLRDQA